MYIIVNKKDPTGMNFYAVLSGSSIFRGLDIVI